MPPFAVFLFSLFILLHRATPKTDKPMPIELEKQALLSFFRNVKVNETYNWTESEHTCSWKGVFCDPKNYTVIQLSLPAASLIGNIPENSIGNLSNLLVLSLHNNHLNGSIPSDFCNLALNELYLDNNNFSGHLCNINAQDLEILNVSNNAFTYQIPSFLSNKFPKTSFFGHTNLSHSPNLSCSRRNFSSCSITYKSSENIYVSIFVGLGLLLMLLCCIGKRIYKRRKPRRSSEGGRSNKLVLFDNGINGLDCDEFLPAPAEVLGRGSFGTTYKRVLEEKKTTVVLKRLKDVVVTNTEFESHMEVLGKMKNENVVPLRGYCYSEDEKWLVYDYMHGGSLFDHLHGSIGLSETGLKWDHLKKIALSAARGVVYLHANDIVHGNIKSSNILLQQEANQDAVAKVSDYGLNTLFEVFKTHDFSVKSDVYSFGVLLLELLTGKAPNQASASWNDFPTWVQSVVRDEPKVEIFDMELRDKNIKEMFQMFRIAKDCVSIVLHQRPTMQNVVRMMEEMNVVEIDDWLRQSSDHEPSKGIDDTPSTMFTQDTPSTVTP